MTDIDFDELDQAVNTIMKNSGNTPVPRTSETSDDVEATTPEATPVSVTTTPTAEPAPEAQPSTTSANIPPKRQGRFMDVVHPSSDMKSATASLPIKRLGVTITPPSDSDDNHEESDTSEVSNEPSQPETTEAETPVVNTTTELATEEEVAPMWPDPIDTAQSQELASAPSDETPDESDTPSPTDDISDDTSEDIPTPEPATPLTSPFLPDAKVEKRPLRAIA